MLYDKEINLSPDEEFPDRADKRKSSRRGQDEKEKEEKIDIRRSNNPRSPKSKTGTKGMAIVKKGTKRTTKEKKATESDDEEFIRPESRATTRGTRVVAKTRLADASKDAKGGRKKSLTKSEERKKEFDGDHSSRKNYRKTSRKDSDSDSD